MTLKFAMVGAAAAMCGAPAAANADEIQSVARAANSSVACHSYKQIEACLSSCVLKKKRLACSISIKSSDDYYSITLLKPDMSNTSLIFARLISVDGVEYHANNVLLGENSTITIKDITSDFVYRTSYVFNIVDDIGDVIRLLEVYIEAKARQDSPSLDMGSIQFRDVRIDK